MPKSGPPMRCGGFYQSVGIVVSPAEERDVHRMAMIAILLVPHSKVGQGPPERREVVDPGLYFQPDHIVHDSVGL